ncbi:hypothetical protein EBU95_21540, partial [bacterium]|nr:hypothetical protein [bacterium]
WIAQNIKDQIDRMVQMVEPDMRLQHGYLQGHIETIKKLLDYNNRKEKLEEDKFQDPMAATQTVGMEVESKRKQMSKSARLIKSLYKKHGMKEEIYDHEKEDKSVATYGKKPKFEKSDEKDDMGEDKPKASAVMSGGTTLTGEKRDTIEIDPSMRVRPGQPDPTKKDDKKDDKKKEEKK